MELSCAYGECPHQSVCCTWGVDLTEDEATAIVKNYGPYFVDQVREGEWRTAIWKGKCVFNVMNRCLIYYKEYYPEVCRKFPFEAYEGDSTICPECR
jgi:hypothetical protein